MKDGVAVEIVEGASNVQGIIPQCALSRIAQKIIVASQWTIAGNSMEVSDYANGYQRVRIFNVHILKYDNY